MRDQETKALLPLRALMALAVAGLALGDLLVKSAVVLTMGQGQLWDLGVVNVRLAYNTGVAFGLGATLSPWIVLAATAAIVAVLAVYLYRAAPGFNRVSRAGAILLLGGAVGNLVDRTDGSGVVDYLHTGWFPTFNIADVFVTAGVGLLVVGSIRTPALAPKEEGR
ncbi:MULTISPECIES: signal peptidase II [Paenarthrobacter]|uniref:Lipoprotein signal peptidase n=1 Tax=Paenarthrobacter ureafaciens TaxID=37931 RepID=A0AAX3EIQ0_PAEUR|nr:MULTISPECIES: signal peptidase II [Paenarthrobacter]NKR13898.1 signal peptidase II [Arthrobacter sp. M5]NKR17336.1 signal peptidase II [Arthrobacter sp. M6]OEH58642.1 signal peptidase II [Arthrobacter sp. D2]OEH61518.1 signal peptidase II [Arthrobacter sp. D4]MDO5862985.1 signal peptidase II [Paenarthrobacter sp. SD-2]